MALIKAEKVMTHDNVLLDCLDDKKTLLIQMELANQLTKQMIDKGLIKFCTVLDSHDDIFGDCVKFKALVRAYNPDD